MTEDYKHPPGTLPRNVLLAFILLAGGLMLSHLAGFSGGCWAAALGVTLSEGGMAGLLVVAAGGYALPIVRRLSPQAAPRGLRVVTACVLGLWMLSTLMLILGSIGGLFTGWLWWAVIAVGVVLAAWQARKALEAWRPAGRCDSRALIWVLLAIAAGMWLAGAARAPGLIGLTESYDVLEYHLQVPREFYNRGQITQLQHNCYSYFPLGLEMLFLLGMSIRGGAYEGMYLAKILHGVFGALAVAGVFLALRRQEDSRARFAAGLLATVPMLLYLSFLAMVELAEICCLTLALLWVREYLKAETWKAAACAGLMLGAACAFKYLSVAFVAAPVLAVLVVSSLGRLRRLRHLTIVVAATLLLFSPWLIRNKIYTGNPVFPLATNVFGRAHWSEESNKRWVDGHSPDPRPPVPKPPDRQQPQRPGRAERLLYNLLLAEEFGPMLLITAVVTVAVMIADRKRPAPWDAALIGTCAVQLAAWIVFTRDMPERFIAPAMVPIALLAAGVLAKLAAVQTSPFRRGSVRPAHGPWGLAPAVVVFAATAGVGIFTSYSMFRQSTGGVGEPPFPGDRIAAKAFPYDRAAELPKESRILLVGQAQAFYFPPNTRYSTAFDENLLATLAEKLDAGEMTPLDVFNKLRAEGITHVWVDWWETTRLAMTYGYPRVLSEEVVKRWRGQPPLEPQVPLLEELKKLRLITHTEDVPYPKRNQAADSRPATQPADRAAEWPLITIYTLAAQAPENTGRGDEREAEDTPSARTLPAEPGIR